MRYTIKDFKAEYPDDEACLLSVLENRYGKTCPKCGVIGVKWHPITGRKAFVCSECDKHVYPLADTIFRKSETSLWSWFYAIYLFSVAKNGVSAKELERQLGCTYKTAWRMAKQIRLLMAQDANILSGTIEMDEAYYGKKRETTRGHKLDNKQAIIGMLERGGQVKAMVSKHTDATVIIQMIRQNMDPNSVIYTDESWLYKGVHNFYFHEKVNHSAKQYVRGKVHTNSIEGFWGNTRKAIKGTYHYVSPQYLHSYVDEFVFRYNFRDVPVCPVLLERAVKLS